MADFTKSEDTIISHQKVTGPTLVKSSAQDSSTDIYVVLVCYHATLTTTVASFLIQVSQESSGDETWATIYDLPVGRTSGANTLVNASEGVGQTAITVVSSASFTAGDYVYIEDVNTVADSEWALIQEITDATTITIVDGLTNAKDSADRFLLNAEYFTVQLNLAGVSRWRVLHLSQLAVEHHIMVLTTVVNDIEGQ